MKAVIQISDIISTPCETILPADWGSYRFLYMRTAAGEYDFLLDKEGEAVTDKTLQVQRIEAFFNKQFLPAIVEGLPCLAHVVKQ